MLSEYCIALNHVYRDMIVLWFETDTQLPTGCYVNQTTWYGHVKLA